MSSRRENSAFIALLLIVLVVAPAYALVLRSVHSPTANPSTVFGNLQLQSSALDVNGLGRHGMNLSVNAVIYNPNGFGATLEAANYSVYADGLYLGNGHLIHSYAISPRSTVAISLPVELSWKSAFLATGSYLVGLGNVTWRANGTADIDVGGLPLSLSFEISKG